MTIYFIHDTYSCNTRSNNYFVQRYTLTKVRLNIPQSVLLSMMRTGHVNVNVSVILVTIEPVL